MKPYLTPLRLLFLITVAGGLFRGFDLEHQSFWYDEAVSAQLSQAPLWDIITGYKKDNGNPPLHVILMSIWSFIFGTSDASFRSLSAFIGTLSIPLLFSVTKRITASIPVALIASAILGFSPFHIYFGQEARTYTLTTLLCLLSFLALFRAIEKSAQWRSWILYALFTFLMIYSHYFGIFIILGQMIYFWLEYRQNRTLLVRYFLSLVLAGILYLVWIPSFIEQVTTPNNLGRAFGTWYLHVLSTPLIFSVGTTLLWKETITPIRFFLAIIAIGSFGMPALWGFWHLKQNRNGFRLTLVWLMMPIVIPTLISLFLFPFYYIRYPIAASPALYIFMAMGLSKMARKGLVLCTIGMVLTGGYSLHSYYTTMVKHNWREATSYLDRKLIAGDLVVFDPDVEETTFSHYTQKNPKLIRLVPPPGTGEQKDLFFGTTPMRIPEIYDVTSELLESKRIWLVLSYPKGQENDYYKKILDKNWHFKEEQLFYGGALLLYEP